MTISSTGPRFSYSGNGTTTVFSFPRQFFLATDLKVYLVDNTTGVATLQVLNTNYTITGAGSPSGGNVTMLSAPATGKTLVIYRDTPYTQSLDLDNVTTFPMTSVEAGFDRAMMAIDEVNTKALKGSLATFTSMDYNLPVPVAKKFLRVKSDVTGLEWGTPPSWLNGAGTPDPSLGVVDDYYLNTLTGTYYQKIGASTWQSLGSLMGPPGSAGSASAAREIDNVNALLVNNTLTYTVGSSNTVAAGDIIKTREFGFVYQVLATGAGSWHVQTAGGIKMNVLPGEDGYSLKAFGAKGDGSTDDTTAIQKALSTGGDVSATAGTYVTSSLLTAAGGTRFRGAGTNQTFFKVNTGSFLKITDGANFARTQISDFTVLPALTNAASTYGIKAEFSVFSPLRNSIAIHNIQFRGSDGVIQSTKGFEKYIWVENVYGGEAHNIRIEGGYIAFNDPTGQFAQTGLHIGAQSIGFYASHCNFNSCHTGIKCDGITEGAFLYACEMVGSRDGYDMRGPQPAFWMTSCHTNSTRNGVLCDGRPQVNITGCSFYRAPTFFEEVYCGIHLKDCNGAEIIGNEVVNSINPQTVMSRGIYAESGNFAINVSSLTLRQLGEGITHGGTNTGCHYSGIIFMPCVTGFSVGGTDANIRLGYHSFVGSNTTRYVISTPKNSITIDRGRDVFNRVTGNTTVTAGATKLINIDADAQAQRFSFGAGGGAYTYNIDLDIPKAELGDFWEIFIAMPSSTNPTVVFRNGSGGATLYSLNAATAATYCFRFVFDGSQWLLQSSTKNI